MGRFGPVYRAFHPDTGDLIAVKQIHHDRVNRKELRNILVRIFLLLLFDCKINELHLYRVNSICYEHLITKIL